MHPPSKPTSGRWQDGLKAALQPLDPTALVVHVPSIDSTNTELMRRAREGDTRTCLLWADAQTAGRGRLGRQWHTQAGDALTFSLGLMFAPQSWSGLSLAVGCCLVQCLDPTGEHGLGLKWPNDLVLGRAQSMRKLGGILIETVVRSGEPEPSRYAVMGVGLNLSAPSHTDMRLPPAGLRESLGPDWQAEAVLSTLLPSLVQGLQRFTRHGFEAFAPAFAQRDALFGAELRLSNGQEGLGAGVDAQGVLRLDTPEGLRSVHSDEVSVREANA